MATVIRKQSSVWNYFSISVDDETKVICMECKEEVARGGAKTKTFSTSNMRKHLRTHHPDKLKELAESKNSAAKSQASSLAGPSQVTIEEYLERCQPFPSDHRTARKITILIGEMIALDCQPFSIIEDQGFVSLLNQLQPRYNIPSFKYFSATLIP